jgi:acyl carrier protein
MTDIYSRIDEALIMSGLKAAQIEAIKAGAPIYGDNGQVDSLGLVRLISAVSSSFEDRGVDMFDMMADLDVEAVEAFADRASIHAFVSRFVSETESEVA